MKSQAFLILGWTLFLLPGCGQNSQPSTPPAEIKKDKANESGPSEKATDVAKKSDDKTPKILATAPWESDQIAPHTGFVHDAAGAAILVAPLAIDRWNDVPFQKEATAKLAKVFKVDTIDWSKQMMLLIEAGQRKTGGYGVEVTGLEVKDKALIVKWKLNEPKADGAVSQVVTYPAIAVLIDRFEGEVKFEPGAR